MSQDSHCHHGLHNTGSSSLYHYAKTEKSAFVVLLISLVVMAIELVSGVAFDSTALISGGVHMLTHVATFGLAVFCYRYAREHSEVGGFSFSRTKVIVLGSFASAVGLVVISILMFIEIIHRFFEHTHSKFQTEAITVYSVGLIVNIISAAILKMSNPSSACLHSFAKSDSRPSGVHGNDYNIKAAYMHIASDILISSIGVVGLVFRDVVNIQFFDSVLGVSGTCVVMFWSVMLLRETTPILLDSENLKTKREIVKAVESETSGKEFVRVTDLHICHLSDSQPIVIMSIDSNKASLTPESCKAILQEKLGAEIFHITVEVNKMSR